MDEYTCSGWACTDCLFELANGESPADLSAEELAARATDIAERNAGYTIALGMLREEHSCLDENGQTAGDLGGECDSFSWSACDVCGSNLGGERHAVSFLESDQLARGRLDKRARARLPALLTQRKYAPIVEVHTKLSNGGGQHGKANSGQGQASAPAW